MPVYFHEGGEILLRKIDGGLFDIYVYHSLRFSFARRCKQKKAKVITP
jgi:hypothetical protein